MRKQPEAIHGVSYLILNFQTAFNENFLVHIPIRFLSSVTRCELDHFFYIYKCKVHFHKKYYFSYHNRGVNTQDNLAWISKVLISSVISLCLPPLDKQKTVYTIGPVYTRYLIHETKFIQLENIIRAFLSFSHNNFHIEN